MSAGGFDVVIGNPPYGSYFSDKEKIFIKLNYDFYENRYENYVYFIELSLKLAKQNGHISFITPIVWLNLDNFAKLRKFLIKDIQLESLNILGENIFSEATVNTLIFNSIKTFSNSNVIKIEKNEIEWTIKKDNINESNSYKINIKITPSIEIIKNKLNFISIPLGSIGEVSQGITAYDKYRGQSKEIIESRAYHSTTKIDINYGKWLNGQDLQKWSINWSGEWLNYGDWLAAKRELKFFKGDRLLFREIPGRNQSIQSTYVSDLYYYGHSITPFISKDDKFSLKYILCICNSNVVSFYGRFFLPNFAKEIFPKINPKDIKEIPIPNISPESQLPFIELADIMLEKNKELQEIKNKFLDLLKADYSIDKLSTKLQNWYEISWADFTSELKKLKIELKGEMKEDWSERFNRMKAIAMEIKELINTTDRKIDLLVYELYELTEEEIKVVEGE
ncbi:MAG: TaqI-like C-terminal specificity domain-containing protein, partial [Candidatus Kapabacteria bacterium]|nr:TaqI-like C-terminal specificity domain-containing protein [Candidatus Kapabacteria bacterium]